MTKEELAAIEASGIEDLDNEHVRKLLAEVRRLQANVRDLDLKLEERSRGYDVSAKHHETCHENRMALFKQHSEAMAEQAETHRAEVERYRKALDLALAGWRAETRSLFDEEAVEGWAWFDPSGKEAGCVIGAWGEPPPPPEFKT